MNAIASETEDKRKLREEKNLIQLREEERFIYLFRKNA